MLDLAKINGSDMELGLIEENLNAAPEAQILPARTISGTAFRSLVRTAYGSTGFRRTGEGRAVAKSTYDNKIHETFYFDAQLAIDNAIVQGSEYGEGYVQTLEASGAIRSALIALGKQVWYGNATGTVADTKGFPGASQFVDAAHTVDATGSTANAGNSVYMIVADPKYFNLIFGKNRVLTMGEWRKQTLFDANNLQYTGWVNSAEGWIGTEFASIHAVVRIKNITAQNGKTLTDSLLSQAMALFPVGVRPTHIFMNRVVRQQLQASRTVTLFGQGTGKPGGNQATVAPTPTEYDGVPIIATDSLTSTEAIA